MKEQIYMRKSLVGSLVVIAVLIFGQTIFANASVPGTQNFGLQVSSDHAPHPFLTRDAAKVISSSGGSNLKYNGGPVITNSIPVQPVYWGATITNGDLQSGLSSFYNSYNMSSVYSPIATQYYNSQRTKVTQSLQYVTPAVDTTTASVSNPISNPTAILNEIGKAVGASNIQSGAYYPLYTDIPRGSANYCAFHGSGTINGISITYGFFFSLANDSGCTANNSSISLSTTTQSVINVTAHEFVEMITDPNLNAWYDARGYEIGDKCAWKFKGTETLTGVTPNPTFLLQGEWSNAITNCAWSGISG